MKGFVHLLEISIATLMIVMAFIIIGSYTSPSFDRENLIILSDNVYNIIKTNLSFSDKIVPYNVRYGMRVSGIPKPEIKICCNCSFDGTQWLINHINNIYMNGRWINFTIENCPLEEYYNYDVLFLINYTEWNSNRELIDNWTRNNKLIFAINDASDDQDFLDIFNLTLSSGSGQYNDFYDKYDAKRLFSGVGYKIDTPYTYPDGKYGYWKIWKMERRVNKTSDYIQVDGYDNNIYEGDYFTLTRGSDGSVFKFRLKKIFENEVWIQSVNLTNIFEDFSDNIKVTGNVIVGTATYGTAIENNSAVWVSWFDDSDEYTALIESLILYKELDWTFGAQDGIIITNFISRCCDVPEFARIDLILGYKY